MPISREELTAYEPQVDPALQKQQDERKQKWDAARAAVDSGDIATAKRLMKELRDQAEEKYRALYGGLNNG